MIKIVKERLSISKSVRGLELYYMFVASTTIKNELLKIRDICDALDEDAFCYEGEKNCLTEAEAEEVRTLIDKFNDNIINLYNSFIYKFSADDGNSFILPTWLLSH